MPRQTPIFVITSARPRVGKTLVARALTEYFLALRKPVVARVTGHVRAGGLGLLAACDIAAASTESTFAFTEVRIGVAPAVISLPLLPRTDPRALARYYLTGERFDAAEAARTGLLTATGPDVDEALAPVLDGLRRASPQGLAETKALLTAEGSLHYERPMRSRGPVPCIARRRRVLVAELPGLFGNAARCGARPRDPGGHSARTP